MTIVWEQNALIIQLICVCELCRLQERGTLFIGEKIWALDFKISN